MHGDDGLLLVRQDGVRSLTEGLALGTAGLPLLALRLAEGVAIKLAVLVEERAEIRALGRRANPVEGERLECLLLGLGQAEGRLTRGLGGLTVGLHLGHPLLLLGRERRTALGLGLLAERTRPGDEVVVRDLAVAELFGEGLHLLALRRVGLAERLALLVRELRALGPRALAARTVRALGAVTAAAPRLTITTRTVAPGLASVGTAALPAGTELGDLSVGEDGLDLGGGLPERGRVGVPVALGEGVEG